MKDKINEDGGAVMSAGAGGFSSSAAAAGPVAGFDPIMGFKKRVKKAIVKRGPSPKFGPVVGDNV